MDDSTNTCSHDHLRPKWRRMIPKPAESYGSFRRTSNQRHAALTVPSSIDLLPSLTSHCSRIEWTSPFILSSIVIYVPIPIEWSQFQRHRMVSFGERVMELWLLSTFAVLLGSPSHRLSHISRIEWTSPFVLSSIVISMGLGV